MTTATTEKQFERQVLDLLHHTGWTLRYHTYRSRRSPSGFPDEVWVRDRVIFAELKSDTGKLKPDQARWLRGLLAAGAEAYVVRPADLLQLAKVLTSHHHTSNPLTERTRAETCG